MKMKNLRVFKVLVRTGPDSSRAEFHVMRDFTENELGKYPMTKELLKRGQNVCVSQGQETAFAIKRALENA